MYHQEKTHLFQEFQILRQKSLFNKHQVTVEHLDMDQGFKIS